MWSLDMIQYLNQKAAKKARREAKEPYVPTQEEIKAFPPFPIPHLGGFVPPGWHRTERSWFVDSSGFGQPGEPALTAEEFREELRHYAEQHPDDGFGIVEAGQFQLYVGAYRRKAA